MPYKIVIKYSKTWEEYMVPGIADGKPSYIEDHIYYTDDKEDAIGTAKAIFGNNVDITFIRCN